MGCQLCTASSAEETDEQAIIGEHALVIPDKLDLLDDHQKIKDFLAKVKLFKRLPKDQHDALASACTEECFEKGHRLINQGDAGDAFYIIMVGSVTVEIDGSKVATLRVGDYMGEMALLRNEPRNASIVADVEITVLQLTRGKFQEMNLADKLEFKHRVAVAGGGGGAVVTQPPSVKTSQDKESMMKALKSNKNLTDIVDLDDDKCNSLIDVAWEEIVPAGEAIIEQGSDQADYFYIVKSGTFDVFVAKKEDAQSVNDTIEHMCPSKMTQVGTIPSGGSFGELALIFYAPRAATVTANGEAVLWVIDRGSFKNIIHTAAKNKAKENLHILDQSEFFSCLKEDEKAELVVAMHEINFQIGEVIYAEGDKAEHVYLLIDGEVAEVSSKGKERRRLKGTSLQGEVFGESALVFLDAPRMETMKVMSDTAQAFQIDRASFEMLLAPYAQIKKRGAQGGASLLGRGRKSVNKAADRIQVQRDKDKFLLEDLKVIGLLGCGGFGAVELVEHEQTKDAFALKQLSKGHVVKCRMQDSVMREKRIQYMCDSNFIVKLYECYNEPQTLCFLLELALGGELYDTYCKKGFHGSVPHAQFYAAATLFAFEHLHARKVVYRDLKPENLLLDNLGHCKLTDMGLAKIVVGKTTTSCGTPDYLAPEVIAGSGHSLAVDWWTLGILIFELLAGNPPFEADTSMQIMKKVQAGIDQVKFPAKMKGSGTKLVKSLLKEHPNDRLPMRVGGIDNIQAHAWYKKFDWKGMRDNKVKVPYKPVVKGKTDLKNFSANACDKPPVIKYEDDGSGWDDEFET